MLQLQFFTISDNYRLFCFALVLIRSVPFHSTPHMSSSYRWSLVIRSIQRMLWISFYDAVCSLLFICIYVLWPTGIGVFACLKPNDLTSPGCLEWHVRLTCTCILCKMQMKFNSTNMQNNYKNQVIHSSESELRTFLVSNCNSRVSRSCFDLTACLLTIHRPVPPLPFSCCPVWFDLLSTVAILGICLWA